METTKGIFCLTSGTINRLIKSLERGASSQVANELRIIADPSKSSWNASGVEQIVEVWQNITGMSLDKIRTKNRSLRYRYPRYVLSMVLYECTHMSELEASRFVGYADHTGVIHAKREIKISLKYYPNDELARMYQTVLSAVVEMKKTREVEQ